jgi:3-oxoacyl-[acyl-carrier protein] reductase
MPGAGGGRRAERPPAAPLAGRVALVTGASRGIGRTIALALAQQGAYAFVNYRQDRRGADECVARLREAGGAGEAVRADVRHPGDVAGLFARIRRRGGRLDILVSNAGVAPRAPGVERVPLKAWRETLATNLTGAFLCTRAASPMMRRQRFGRIIYVGSLAGMRGGTIGPHYAASKAGLLGLMQWTFRELAPYGVTVNVVAPAFVLTALTAASYRTAAARARMAARVPLGRPCAPEEVAAAVAFLAGPDAGYITGECLTMAGGR